MRKIWSIVSNMKIGLSAKHSYSSDRERTTFLVFGLQIDITMVLNIIEILVIFMTKNK